MGDRPLEASIPVPNGLSFSELVSKLFQEVFLGNHHPSLRTRMSTAELKVNNAAKRIADLEECVNDSIKVDIGLIKADLLTITRISKYLLTPLMLTIATGIGVLLWALLTHQVSLVVAAAPAVVP